MIKEELKKILLSLTEDDYFKIADLHIHTNESDGKLSPVEVVDQAKRNNLKYISIADHNNIDAYLSTNILAENIVIPAVEFDCFFKGNLIHILGYGIDIDNMQIRELFAKTRAGRTHNIVRLFNLRNPVKVIDLIKKAGGIPVLAHPACIWTFSLEEFIKDLVDLGLEGVEVYYPYHGLRGILKFHSKQIVIKIAEKYNLIKTGGSDTHGRKLDNNL